MAPRAPLSSSSPRTKPPTPPPSSHKGVEFLQKAPDATNPTEFYENAYQAFVKSAELAEAAGNTNIAIKARYNAGWAAETLGRLEDAGRHYQRAYEADGAYEDAMFSLARINSARGNHDANVTLFKAYMDAKPGDESAANEYISALTEAGRYDEAISESERILRQNPKSADVYRNLSALYYAQGKYGLSQLCAEKALALRDTDPGIYNNMGVTFLIQEDEPAASRSSRTRSRSTRTTSKPT